MHTHKRITNIGPLISALPPSLLVLDLSGPPVDRGQLCDLTPVASAITLGRLPNLEALLAPHHAIDNASVAALAASVKHAPALLRLDLFQNAFGQKAARGLVEAVEHRAGMLLLDAEFLDGRRPTMAKHGLADADAELLSLSLRACRDPAPLSTLDLGHNELALQEGGGALI